VDHHGVEQFSVGCFRDHGEGHHAVWHGPHFSRRHVRNRRGLISIIISYLIASIFDRTGSLWVVAFSDRLAELRRSRGLTQVALARRVQINVSQLRRYEAGAAEPSLGVLRRLATGLSVSSDLLVFGTEERLPSNDALRMAFEATDHLDPEERDAVQVVLEGFLARHEARLGGEGPRSPKSKRE
jgi:transcriptional regulator with XRE-family HTH domain